MNLRQLNSNELRNLPVGTKCYVRGTRGAYVEGVRIQGNRDDHISSKIRIPEGGWVFHTYDSLTGEFQTLVDLTSYDTPEIYFTYAFIEEEQPMTVEKSLIAELRAAEENVRQLRLRVAASHATPVKMAPISEVLGIDDFEGKEIELPEGTYYVEVVIGSSGFSIEADDDGDFNGEELVDAYVKADRIYRAF